MRRAFEHPLAPALGCALRLRGLSAGLAGDRRHGRALLPRVAVRAPGPDGLERAVVRRPSRARATRCCSRRWPPRSGPRSSACCAAVAAVALFVPLARAAAPSPDRGRGRRPGCSRPACSRTSRSGGCRSCSGSRSAVGAWSAARAERRVLSGVLGLCAMLASPVAGVFLMLGAAAKLIADGRPALAHRGVARAARRWRAGSRSTCCSRRAAPTASRRPRSGRCW